MICLKRQSIGLEVQIKYRMSVFTREEDHTGGKSERRSISEMLPNFGVTSGAQLAEALQIQKEAQRRWSDQKEVQKSLKLKIEAQDFWTG